MSGVRGTGPGMGMLGRRARQASSALATFLEHPFRLLVEHLLRPRGSPAPTGPKGLQKQRLLSPNH